MIGWIERPFDPPHRCALTLRDAPADGPYYSTGFSYFHAMPSPDGPRPGGFEQLYLAPQAVVEMCRAQGSPLRVYTADDDADNLAQLDALESENAELSAQLEEARARIAELEQHVNADIVAQKVVSLLDARERKAKPSGKSAA